MYDLPIDFARSFDIMGDSPIPMVHSMTSSRGSMERNMRVFSENMFLFQRGLAENPRCSMKEHSSITS